MFTNTLTGGNHIEAVPIKKLKQKEYTLLLFIFIQDWKVCLYDENDAKMIS